MFVRGYFLCCLLALALPVNNIAYAEDSTTVERVTPEIHALRINPHAPAIDGRLDDPVWNSPKLVFATNFTQDDPDEGLAATESTKVAVRYDDEALYFAFWCYDSEPDKIASRLVRRDRWAESDMISIRLDPFHDHQSGYAFDLSAAGVQRDCRIYNENNTDFSWDGIWSSGVQRQPWGWAAEVRIPYHCLRFAEQDEHVWGVDFIRIINRKTEWDRWAFTPSSEGGFASKFGHMTGLSGIAPARHLEVLPHTVSKVRLDNKTPGNPDGRSAYGNVGLDVKYGLSSNLTLDATINPDFGQVELDEPVLNLSAFETYFPERRPFFMEGADLFATDFTLFYSRRIGRAPGGYIMDPEYDYEIDRPDATTILGAAKLTGKLSGGTSIAFLTALTQEEKEDYRTVTGLTRDGVIEPEANYSVLRVKQDVFANSFIGGMMTLASQDTRHPATTGGVDWRLYTNDGGWRFSGQGIFSRTGVEKTGFGLNATIQKMSGKHWRGSVNMTIKDPHLDIWRLGYTSRNDIRHTNIWLQYRTQDDWWIFRNTYNEISAWSDWNYNGDDISRGGNLGTYIEFINNWSVSINLAMQAEKYSDVETRGYGLWEWPVYPTFATHIHLDTDPRRMLSFCFGPSVGTDRGGDWWSQYIAARYRPRSNLEFSTSANYHRTFHGTRWISNYDHDNDPATPRYVVFGDLDKDELSLDLTASVMLTRNLSWQISGQGLISSLDYRDYKRYLGNDSYARDFEFSERDGTYSALNTMMLVRWEYFPGSTLYFVWTRSRPEWDSSVNNFELKDELDRFFSRGAENIWLVKASYWWNL